jgi:hypothetical protein
MKKKPKIEEKIVNYDTKAKVTEEWVGGNPTAGGIKSRWWAVEPENQYQHITAVTNAIMEAQSYQQQMNLRYARLYANQELSGFGLGVYDRVTPTSIQNRASYNVVKACVDAASAKIAKQRPRIVALTNGGSWNLQQRSKKLSKYIGGVFNNMNAYQEMSKIFVDACVFGTGALKVFQDGTTIKCERVFINEIITDQAESIYGQPRQLHQIKYISRDVLANMFPEHADKIMSANSGMPGDNSTTTSYAADYIAVIESWHLKSGKNAKDGVKTISISNCTLDHQSYDKDDFPFLFLKWSRRLLGFFGVGIAEELIGIQIEINKLLRDIQSAQNLACVPRVLIESGSSVVEDHINNKIGSIIKYTGTAPTIVTANAMPTELYNFLETLYQKAFQITGISQLSASSQKPAGLNSGVALREYQDIETERFSLVSQAYEDMFIELGNRCIDLSKELSEINPKLSINVVGSQLVEEISWKDIQVSKDQFVLQLYPASLLPTQPAGRLQRVQELLQAGMINQTTAKSLLDMPDLDDAMDNELAAYNDIHATLEFMMETKEYSAPEPFQDPALCIQIAKSQYLRAKTRRVDESDLELLRRFIEDSAALIENAAQANQPQQAPIAQPQSAPTSDMLPFAGIPNA